MCRYTCPKRRRRRAQRSARQNGGRGKEGITDRARGLFKRRVMQEEHDFLGGTILFKRWMVRYWDTCVQQGKNLSE